MVSLAKLVRASTLHTSHFDSMSAAVGGISIFPYQHYLFGTLDSPARGRSDLRIPQRPVVGCSSLRGLTLFSTGRRHLIKGPNRGGGCLWRHPVPGD